MKTLRLLDDFSYSGFNLLSHFSFSAFWPNKTVDPNMQISVHDITNIDWL